MADLTKTKSQTLLSSIVVRYKRPDKFVSPGKSKDLKFSGVSVFFFLSAT